MIQTGFKNYFMFVCQSLFRIIHESDQKFPSKTHSEQLYSNIVQMVQNIHKSWNIKQIHKTVVYCKAFCKTPLGCMPRLFYKQKLITLSMHHDNKKNT